MTNAMELTPHEGCTARSCRNDSFAGVIRVSPERILEHIRRHLLGQLSSWDLSHPFGIIGDRTNSAAGFICTNIVYLFQMLPEQIFISVDQSLIPCGYVSLDARWATTRCGNTKH